MPNDYCLSDVSKEKVRLKLLESEFDNLTHKRLEAANILPGNICLEIGPGAGSIARWMSEKVGDTGKVIVVDKIVGNFDDGGKSNITFHQSDIRSKDVLEAYRGKIDLIHTRFLLVHLDDAEAVVEELLSLLKPGGYLVFEEPDFSSLSPLNDKEDISYNVIKSLQSIVMKNGDSNMIARKLPFLFSKNGLCNLSIESYTPIRPGNSHLSEMLKRTVKHLDTAILNNSDLSMDDLEKFYLHCDNPKAWIRECQIIGIIGSKPI